MTGDPLYCRISGVEGDLVEYEEIYHREDGSERIGSLAAADRGLHRGDLRRLVRGQLAAVSAGTSASSGPAGAPGPTEDRGSASRL